MVFRIAIAALVLVALLWALWAVWAAFHDPAFWGNAIIAISSLVASSIIWRSSPETQRRNQEDTRRNITRGWNGRERDR